MASRPTYGKRNRNLLTQPLWSSPSSDQEKPASSGEKKTIPSDQNPSASGEEDYDAPHDHARITPSAEPKSTPSIENKITSSDEDEIAGRIEGLTIATTSDDADPTIETFDPNKTPTPADPYPPTSPPNVGRPTRQTRGNATATEPEIDLDIGPLLAVANSDAIMVFSDYADTVTKKYIITKHAEGSFGDVYKVSKSGLSNTKAKLAEAVLKIIPIGARTGPGSRKYSQVDDIVCEVKLLKALDPVHGFTRFRGVHVVQGTYPPAFVKAFSDFKRSRVSESPAPEKFRAQQMFAIVEMDDAGYDLDTLRYPNLFQIYDIFWSTVIVVANSEKLLQFEHRDMHASNICIRPLIKNGRMDVREQDVKTWAKDQVRYLGLTELRVTLIDYGLSRAKVDGDVAFVDLKKKAFLRPALDYDPDETPQQRSYRQQMQLIRAASGGGKKEDWSLSMPKTNIVWLACLLEVLMEQLDNDDVVKGSNKDCVMAQRVMFNTLKDVLAALKEWIVEDAWASAALLLDVAVSPARGWLREEEVEWYKQQLESEA